MANSSILGQSALEQAGFRVPDSKQVSAYPTTSSTILSPLVPPEQSVVPTFRVSVDPSSTEVASDSPATPILPPIEPDLPSPSMTPPPNFGIKSRIRPEDVSPTSVAPPSLTMPFFQPSNSDGSVFGVELGKRDTASASVDGDESTKLPASRELRVVAPHSRDVNLQTEPSLPVDDRRAVMTPQTTETTETTEITETTGSGSSPPGPTASDPPDSAALRFPTTEAPDFQPPNIAPSPDNASPISTPTATATQTPSFEPLPGEGTEKQLEFTPKHHTEQLFGFPGSMAHDGCGHFHAPFNPQAFCPDPNYRNLPYDPETEMGIYTQKWNQCSQRPLLEFGRGIYRNGPVPRSYSFLGDKNLITPGFNVLGDFRSGVAINDNGVGNPVGVWANRLNLDFDLRLTATERIHWFMGPLDRGNQFTRLEYRTDGKDNLEFFEEFDDEVDTIFFEGDLGYIWGGMTDQWAPFDMPFVFGKFPLLFSNGIWILDAVEGFAFTIPARNSALLDWSNFEFTFFGILDDIDSPAFLNDDNAADAYGFNSFIEAYGGYTEFGYAYVNDRTDQGLSYHSLTFSHTRRFFERISNSVRFIINTGQDPVRGPQTADGQLILIENALVSSNPTYYVPYFNVFAGFDRPQSLATVAGPLLNTGINFETDGLTGFPRLTDTGQDAWGGAFGFNLLGPRFRWQWILEAAMLQSFGNSPNGDEYAVGSRFQMPINFAWLVRFDAMYGLRENAADISGVKAELRWKF